MGPTTRPSREGKGYIAVPACGGSLAEAKTCLQPNHDHQAGPAQQGHLQMKVKDSFPFMPPSFESMEYVRSRPLHIFNRGQR
eukprot:1147891-Pelagomonas_calceolata.AAC.1